MPFEFLSDEHIARYNQFTTDPSPQELLDHFRLSAEDRKLILAQHEPHNRLGMAIQPVTLKFRGILLNDPTDVPKVVVRFMAEQLGISDTRILSKYLGRYQTRFDHTKIIRKLLYAKLLVADERPIPHTLQLCKRG